MEVKYDKSHHAGADANARVHSRLKNSGGEEGFTIHTGGDAPQRVCHNIHEKGNVMQRGPDNKGEGSIIGTPRGVANPKGQIE